MVAPPTFSRCLAGATFALATVGCAGPAEVPDTPDLRELLSEYQQPSATLDQQTVSNAFASAPNIQTLAAGFTTVSAATPGINDANDKLERRSDSSLRIQGSLRITLTCPGDGPEPTLDAAQNGTIVLTLGVEETRILRGIGALADQCLARPSFLGQSVRVSLDGPIAIDLGRDLGKGDGALELLISLLGEVQIGDTVFRSINGRFTRDGFESLFVLQDGSTVVLTAKGDGRIGVRDRQGFWNCSADTFECDLDSP